MPSSLVSQGILLCISSDLKIFTGPGYEPQTTRQTEVQMPTILTQGIISIAEAEELFQM